MLADILKDFGDIPEYKTIAGQFLPVGSIGKTDRRVRIQNTTVEECREYADFLEKSGFKKQAEREISAGKECFYNINLYYAFTGKGKQLFVFWDASVRSVFITAEALGALPETHPIPLGEKRVTATFAQAGLKVGGMCYIVRLSSGEFVVIDGGKHFEEDVDGVYEYLKEHSPFDKPIVALWIFTHSHKDHIGMATLFLEKYSAEVEIKAFSYQFPDCDKISVSMDSVPDMKELIAKLEKNIAANYPEALIYALHTGQTYRLFGAEIEILWSVDDTYPSFYTSFNDMSAAMRLKFDSGKTVMIMGDCMSESNKLIAGRYGDYLKSDIMQVVHHGLLGGDKCLYKLVNPDICFWPQKEERFLGKTPGQRYQWCLGEGGCDYNAYLRDNSVRQREHYHHGKTVTVEV
ncbi:MAG: hypothetical protein J5836_01945 [Clostridia bacterium]|nr:hypothetical protein [Clostridia bacterium]